MKFRGGEFSTGTTGNFQPELTKYLQLKSAFGWSLSNLVALLRQQLFVYRDLWAWINDPFQPPPIPQALPEQLALQLP